MPNSVCLLDPPDIMLNPVSMTEYNKRPEV